jgi:hypothetical protein
MFLALSLAAGAVLIGLAEALGLLHVRRFDVSRRHEDIRTWRRAQALGLIFIPSVAAFWFVTLTLTGGARFRESWSSGGPEAFIFGAAAFVLAALWARLLAFWCLTKHAREAAEIIFMRRRDGADPLQQSS